MIGNLIFILMASVVSIFIGFLIGKNNQKKKQDKIIQDLRCNNEMLKTALNPSIHIGTSKQYQIEDIVVYMHEDNYISEGLEVVIKPHLSSAEKLHIIANEIAKQIEQRPYLLNIHKEQMFTQYALSVIKYDEL